MVSTVEIIDIFLFGMQLYLGVGGTVAARVETIDDMGECQTE